MRTKTSTPTTAQSTNIVFQPPKKKAQRVVKGDYAIQPVQTQTFRILGDDVNMYVYVYPGQ